MSYFFKIAQKAQYICGKTFHLKPILRTYKKKLIKDPITDKILKMTERGDVDKIGTARQIFGTVLKISRHGTPNFRRVIVSAPNVMWHQCPKF